MEYNLKEMLTESLLINIFIFRLSRHRQSVYITLLKDTLLAILFVFQFVIF